MKVLKFWIINRKGTVPSCNDVNYLSYSVGGIERNEEFIVITYDNNYGSKRVYLQFSHQISYRGKKLNFISEQPGVSLFSDFWKNFVLLSVCPSVRPAVHLLGEN